MFYQVRVMDTKGKVKKVISTQELSNKHWKEFYDNAPIEKNKGRKINLKNS